MIHQKADLLQVFGFFEQDLMILTLLNQQIITIIGKLGQKIPKLHITS
jgi:hypothetical protein